MRLLRNSPMPLPRPSTLEELAMPPSRKSSTRLCEVRIYKPKESSGGLEAGETYKCTAKIFGNSQRSTLRVWSPLSQSSPNSVLSRLTVKKFCNHGYSSSWRTKNPIFELFALSPDRAWTMLPSGADSTGPNEFMSMIFCVS